MKQLKPACANTAPQMELQNCLHLKKIWLTTNMEKTKKTAGKGRNCKIPET